MSAEPELVVVSLLRPAAGHHDEVVGLLTEELPQCHQEPGVERFAMYADAEDPGRLVVIEVYQRAADLEAHYTTPYFQKIAEQLPPLLDGPVDIVRMAPVVVGEDPKSSLGLQ